MLNEHLYKEKKRIYNAICHYTLFNHPEINDDFFKKLINFIELSNIPDREFLSNKRIKAFVDYERVSKKQFLRLMIRDQEIINKINIDKFKFKVKELERFLKVRPDLIGLFNFDMSKISGDELMILLELNQNYFLEADLDSIDLSKYHITNVIKNHSKNETIMMKLLSCNSARSKIDNFHARSMIIKTGKKYIEHLDISGFTEFDWFEIIKTNPELISCCDMSVFEKNDCYFLAKLARFVPTISPYIFKNKDKISNLGWEHLLRVDFETYYPMCCFDCLEPKTQRLFIDRLSPR